MKNDQAIFYSKNYQTQTFLLEEGLVLGNKDNRKCRFCGLSQPEVKFSNKAHAIPESLGNKHVISYYECNNCNSHFGNDIENHLGMYYGGFRTITLQGGKDGIPTYKHKDIEIRAQADTLQVKVAPDSSLVGYNEETGELTLTIKRLQYIPIAVYKAYIKMALTMMDESDFLDFPATLNWIKETEHKLNWPGFKLIAYTKFINGKHVFPVPEVHLLFRRSDAPVYLPYAWMILCTGNQVIQLMIPYGNRDERFKNYLEQGNVWRFIPHPQLLAPGASDKLDWSGSELVRNEIITLTACSLPGLISVEDQYDFSELLKEVGLSESDLQQFIDSKNPKSC